MLKERTSFVGNKSCQAAIEDPMEYSIYWRRKAIASVIWWLYRKVLMDADSRGGGYHVGSTGRKTGQGFEGVHQALFDCWNIEGGVLLLTLQKDRKTWWDSAFMGDPKIYTSLRAPVLMSLMIRRRERFVAFSLMRDNTVCKNHCGIKLWENKVSIQSRPCQKVLSLWIRKRSTRRNSTRWIFHQVKPKGILGKTISIIGEYNTM